MNARSVVAILAIPAVLGLVACSSGGGLSDNDQAICDEVKASRSAGDSGDASGASSSAMASVIVAASNAEDSELRLAATKLVAKVQQAGDQPIPRNDPDMNTIRRICGISEVS